MIDQSRKTIATLPLYLKKRQQHYGVNFYIVRINKLNPSAYTLVVFDSNRHIIHFKANQTIGQIGKYLKEYL